MASTKTVTQAAPLPSTLMTIEQIFESPSDDIRSGKLVSFIGSIKSFKVPMKTKNDWKSEFIITDHTTHQIVFNIFKKEEDEIPRPSIVGQIILVRNAKLYMYSGQAAVMTNYKTRVHFLLSSSTSKASQQSWQTFQTSAMRPEPTETAYAIWLRSQSDDLQLPTDLEFEESAQRSMVRKEKFSLLKDVKAEEFYDILGLVIKVHDGGDALTVYFSDYTPNSAFYKYSWDEDDTACDGRDGDEFGYTRFKKKPADKWPGPYGKMCIQLTLFGQHAEIVRQAVETDKDDNWLELKNVRIDFGRQGTGVLEGRLREDRQYPGKLQVKLLKVAENPEDNDSRWIEALRRKVEVDKKFEKQKESRHFEATSDNKRKYVDDETPMNAKQRRQQDRAARFQAAAEAGTNVAAKLNLNENIVCGYPEQPITTLRQILEPQKLLRTNNGDEVASPFTNLHYRAYVRVVDYFPASIEDFAVGRRPNVMDMLSDYSGGEATDRDEDMRIYKSGRGFGEKKWEWRFSLQVEDASSEESKERMWLMVDNASAQMLLGLVEDATNLRRESDLLSRLKYHLSILWGELEEMKSAAAVEAEREAKLLQPSSASSIPSSPPRRFGGQPGADSDDDEPDDDELDVYEPISGEGVEHDEQMGQKDSKTERHELKNKAFTCCIKQYGVKAKESDPTKANAGSGQRWERRFGLFGTRIV